MGRLFYPERAEKPLILGLAAMAFWLAKMPANPVCGGE